MRRGTNGKTEPTRWRPWLASALAFAGIWGASSLAHALSFTVNSPADGSDVTPGDGVCSTSAGACTLRAAIEETNATSGMDQVTLPGNSYLIGARIYIQDSLWLLGAGPEATVLDGGGADGVLGVDPPTGSSHEPIVHMSGLTIQRGGPIVTDVASGLRVGKLAYVTCTECRIRDNRSSTFGGGVANGGTLILTRSEVTGNTLPVGGGGRTSTGGGIMNYATGRLTLEQTLVHDNYATRGGGIRNQGRLEISNSTISGNRADGAGGGIYNDGTSSYLIIAHSTITANIANQSRSLGGVEPTLGGGIYNNGVNAQVQLGHSILANNLDQRGSTSVDYAPDCYSTETFRFTSFRRNVVGVLNTNCSFRDTLYGDTRFDQVGTPTAPLDPRLQWLGGTFPRAHGLLPDSPAIDQAGTVGDSTFFDCPLDDQLGWTRPIDGNADGSALCDVGATEFGTAGSVSFRFFLVDSDTNSDLQELHDYDQLYLPALPGRLTIRAETYPAAVGAVAFFDQTNTRIRVENQPPYALGGDTEGDFEPTAFEPKFLQLGVQAFELANAGGKPGVIDWLHVNIIPGFALVDTDTDGALRVLVDGALLDRSQLPPNLTIRANPPPGESVGSVRFSLDGAVVRVENLAPYALQGDESGNYAPANLTNGTHQLSAQAFSGPNGTGTAGTLLQLGFTVQP